MPNSSIFYLQLDKTGLSLDNAITNELHTTGSTANRLILPKFGAFYSDSLRVYSIDPDTQIQTLLQENVGYVATEMLHKVTALVGQSVCTVILITESSINTSFSISYQALGGHDQVNRENLFQLISDATNLTDSVRWEDILNKPKAFPPAPHLQDSLDIYGLEYIVEAINRLDNAIITGDRQAHQTLIDKLVYYKDEVLVNNDYIVQDRVDLVMTLVKSATDTLTIVSEFIRNTTEILDEIVQNTESLNTLIADYKQYNQNDKLANVANILCKTGYVSGSSLLDVPLLYSGLELYLDSQNYNQATRTWSDKRLAFGAYSADVNSAPDYGSSTSMAGIGSVKFTNGKFLTRSEGIPIKLEKGKTIITVLSPLGQNSSMNIQIFNDNSKKLQVDTENEIAYQYSNINNTNIDYLAKTSKPPVAKTYINATCIGERSEDCLALNSSPFTRDNAPNGVMQDSLSLDDISSFGTRIGSASGNQSAEVFMILVYNRVLSRVELHSIMTYIRMKYGANTQQLINGDFTNWDDGFGSDMQNFIDFAKRDCVTVTDRNIGVWDRQDTYSQSGAATRFDVKIDNNPYLLVLSSSSSKAFWRQTLDLDPYCRYEFSLSVVYGQISKPEIRIKINDVFLPGTVTLLDDTSVVRDFVFSFTPNTKVNKIELVNMNEDFVNNIFGVGAMRLVRKIIS